MAPVTQSARSRWSFGKIEDCEQSSTAWDNSVQKKIYLVFFIPKLCKMFAVNSSAIIVIGVSIIIKRGVRKVRVFCTRLIWVWGEQDFSTFYTWVRKYQLTWLKTKLVTICPDKTSSLCQGGWMEGLIGNVVIVPVFLIQISTTK